MSFTSTLSVRSRTVLVSVVELFLSNPTSMENILQSIVKIIIIGSLYENVNTKANRQFLPPLPPLPPLPYFQNGGFAAPGFGIPYREPIPIYYQDDTAPPPISYQNMNSYVPAQLFRQNENYNPLFAANPGNTYPTPPVLPYNPTFRPPHKPQHRVNIGISQINYKKPSQPQQPSVERPADSSPKKTAFYATNIIVKEENHPPYYHDDYGKNYHEDDYSDNYSDEISAPLEPCPNSPYQYFERVKTNPNKFSSESRYNLCKPNFEPNLGSGIYTVKMPITLLPSRFPPRVEELIERIQNYFSTYTQQETPKPQNQTITTTTTTTVQPTTEAASENEAQSTGTLGANRKKNTTAEIEELHLELTNVGAPETAATGEHANQETVIAVIDKVEKKDKVEKVEKKDKIEKVEKKEEIEKVEKKDEIEMVEKKDVEKVEKKEETEKVERKEELTSTSASVFQGKEEPQTPLQETTAPTAKENEVVGITTTTEANPQGEKLQESQQNQPKYHPMMHPLQVSPQGNEVLGEYSENVGIQTGSPQTQPILPGGLATTESTGVTNITGETTTVQPEINVTDSKG